MNNTLTRNEINRSYWDRRAASYTDVIKKNLDGGWDAVWADMLISRFPGTNDQPLKVLDIGCGPGFYSIILARRGFQVTAADFSAEMLEEARKNAGKDAALIEYRQMDAQHLDCPDESYDVIVSRNLTWNLPDPVQAYRDWKRALKPGGALLVFDANWYAYLLDEEKREAFDRDRENTRLYGVEDHEAYDESSLMEEISRELPMTRADRPAWDLTVLLKLGYTRVSADTAIGDTVWNPEEKINYASTPGFLIRAEK